MRMEAVHPPNSTHLHMPDNIGNRAKGRGKPNPKGDGYYSEWDGHYIIGDTMKCL